MDPGQGIWYTVFKVYFGGEIFRGPFFGGMEDSLQKKTWIGWDLSEKIWSDFLERCIFFETKIARFGWGGIIR